MTKKTIIYQNRSISYRSEGKGKIVVLIHGFAEDGNIWNRQADFLKDHFRLIIPDMPGSGRSQLLSEANMETYAEVIKGIIEDLHSDERVTIIGHSMGGYTMLAFAEKYPQYLDAIGLFHSTAFADDEAKKQARSKGILFMKENGAGAFLKASMPGLFTKSFAEKYPETIEGIVENGKKNGIAPLVQYYEAMIARPDRTAVLSGFSKPVLFIIGEHDNAIPLQSSLRQCHLPACSHVHLLSQSAHMGMWEETQKVNNILLNFLVNKF